VSASYQAVGWNGQKRRYDATLAAAASAYLLIYGAVTWMADPDGTIETLVIRASGTLAVLLLHVALIIGPLARLDRRFLPWLYNRRHLGVTTALAATVHGVLSIVQFHGAADVHPLVSVLVTSRDYGSLTDFPFQQLGLLALGILLMMAATSHDFWLRALTPPVWKALHMLVYLAYGCAVAHVALGALQSGRQPVLASALLAGLGLVLTVHGLAARQEFARDAVRAGGTDAFVDVCAVADIPERRARTVCLAGERVAVFRYGDRVSAVSSVCRHQNGPLGEGRIVGDCIVCPWHGYEYDPASGRAPAPFTERVPTFAVRVVAGRVQVDPRAHPPGTYVEPARLEPPSARAATGGLS
jgi:nitrite reductase/ring-hydroxylating ferredoxin subunit/DMSO/TMAO reductase YedYZ heme-binding membrane subunit